MSTRATQKTGIRSITFLDLDDEYAHEFCDPDIKTDWKINTLEKRYEENQKRLMGLCWDTRAKAALPEYFIQRLLFLSGQLRREINELNESRKSKIRRIELEID